MRTKCDGQIAQKLPAEKLVWKRQSLRRLLADGSAGCFLPDGIATGGGGRRVRIVTHLGVGPEDADALVAALTAELGGGEAVGAVEAVRGRAKCPALAAAFFALWLLALLFCAGSASRSVGAKCGECFFLSIRSIDVQPGLLSPEVRLGAGVPAQHIAVGVVLLLHKSPRISRTFWGVLIFTSG